MADKLDAVVAFAARLRSGNWTQDARFHDDSFEQVLKALISFATPEQLSPGLVPQTHPHNCACLLYTSDAADD